LLAKLFERWKVVTNQNYMPARIIGGESIIRDADHGGIVTFAGYTPADGYALVYQFAAASTPFSVSGVASDDDTGWTIEITGAQTLPLQPGILPFAAFATITVDDVDRQYLVDAGTIEVTASPLRVSSWQAVLASVDAAIAEFATTPQGSVTVDGMSVSYRSMTDLIRLREYILSQLRKDTARRNPAIIRSRYAYQ
jgi:hypothetical protein